MAIQLTPEDAAVASVEIAAEPGFEGTQEELEALLMEGMNSGEPVKDGDAFWNRLRTETGRMAAEHLAVESAAVKDRAFPADLRSWPVKGFEMIRIY